MAIKCANCGSAIGGMFGAELIAPSRIAEFKKFIECPDQICTKCDGTFETNYDREKQRRLPDLVSAQRSGMFELEQTIDRIPAVSVDVLPAHARYRLIDLVSFQSTLGTGLFSEIGSDLSNLLGTEAYMLNSKMASSVAKCKSAIKTLAHRAGGNAVIGLQFQFSTNSRDATTVAVQGTAVFIENIDEVFRPSRGQAGGAAPAAAAEAR